MPGNRLPWLDSPSTCLRNVLFAVDQSNLSYKSIDECAHSSVASQHFIDSVKS